MNGSIEPAGSASQTMGALDVSWNGPIAAEAVATEMQCRSPTPGTPWACSAVYTATQVLPTLATDGDCTSVFRRDVSPARRAAHDAGQGRASLKKGSLFGLH